MEECKCNEVCGLMSLSATDVTDNDFFYVLSSVYDYAITNNVTNINYSYPFDDECSFTLLELAIDFGNINIINHILDLGANVNLQDEDGMTPLHYAIFQNKSIDIIKHLIDNGAGLHIQNRDGYSPLQYLQRSYSETVICDILSRPSLLRMRHFESLA